MKKFLNFPVIGAVLTALLSTMCCLPALLFILFGVSSGILTYLSTFEYLRVPLGILSILFFLIGIKRFRAKILCKCKKSDLIKGYILLCVFFVLIIFMLFYPEIIPYFME